MRAMSEVPRSIFVTGTDTGVGKTWISTALLRGFVSRGLRAVGMKPVAAGAHHDAINDVWINDDVQMLRAAANVRVPPELDNPVLLADPLSPHLAAWRAGKRIALAPIVAAHDALLGHADHVVLEGAGGFLVPLDEDEEGFLLTGAELALALKVPIILVVGMRLGCLNHALLTVEAIQARDLTLFGWIANRIDPDMACADENIATLRRQIRAPMLADVGHGNLDAVIIG